MPRDIVLGNGELLVNLDRHLAIRDVYYPYVGWANHVGGFKCRLGVWTDGGFAWLDETWEWQIKYAPDTLVTDCTARHHGLGVLLRIAHTVVHDRNIFLQRIVIENLRDNARDVRLFWANDLRIDETDIGDTAFYDPYRRAVVHYKRDRYFLFSGLVGEGLADDRTGIWQYACGQKGFKGAEGTWRDAEDGLLSNNAIAQGAVDSVHSYICTVTGKGKTPIRTWMVIGPDLDTVSDLQTELIDEGFEETFAKTAKYWRDTIVRPQGIERLPTRVSELLVRSALIMRTQIDRRGAILASNDSDIMETERAHYSYMWPRDGALASFAMDRMGQKDISRAFFEFCARVQPKDQGALMHKYGPDGTLGASWHPWVVQGGGREIPIQEDGTALVVWSMWQHYLTYGDKEHVIDIYNRFVRRAADFLADFRDSKTHLPLPSWDLWEERRGTHIFTTATTIAALNCASQMALLAGDKLSSDRFQAASEQIKEAMLTHFWDEDGKYFIRMVTTGPHGELIPDKTVDSSAYALFAYGVLPADDPKVVSTMQAMGTKLWVKVGVGGLARYERDWYFHVTEDFQKVPGNPWIICTLWLADWYIAIAKNEAEMRGALDLLEWASICALRTGVLSEQVHPFTLQPLSVAPLTWSHAQFITTATSYLAKLAIFDKTAPKTKKK